MYYKLASSRPAQAVDTSDNSRRVDGDGGGAAGTSLAGVGAVSAIGNQSCEIPFQVQSTGAVLDPTTSHCSQTSRTSWASSIRAAQSPGATRSLGNVSLPPGGVAARRTTDPPSPLYHSDPVNNIHPPAPVDAACRIAEFFLPQLHSDPIHPNLPLAPEGAPSVPLKRRCFRIGTWNSRGKSGPSNSSKFATAKLIMRLEKVDLLVLTETHSTDDSPPSVRGLNVLSHSGVGANRAGVAICALDNGHWSCRSSTVLVPGHALICELYNSVSTESFNLLGVYGDISSYAARTSFYENLYTNLSDHILSYGMRSLSLSDNTSGRASRWHGCLAAGDWNFVEQDSDRFPFKVPLGDVRRCRLLFNDIKSICMMTDSAGPSGSYRQHTFAQNTQGGQVLSRLDRIYCPRDGWSATPPVPIRTNHSDHFFVWSDGFITTPKVDLAVPTPRLPPLKVLNDGPFWPLVLTAWSDLTSSDVTLPSWSAFKLRVLQAGLSVSKSRKRSVMDNWKAALRGDGLSSEELADITFDWAAHPTSDPAVGRVAGGRFRSAVPAYDSPPSPSECVRNEVLYPDALSSLLDDHPDL